MACLKGQSRGAGLLVTRAAAHRLSSDVQPLIGIPGSNGDVGLPDSDHQGYTADTGYGRQINGVDQSTGDSGIDELLILWRAESP